VIECGEIIIRTKVEEMTEAFPRERATKRKFLLDAVDSISGTLRASGPRSEELGTLAPDAVDALIRTGMFRLKLAAERVAPKPIPSPKCWSWRHWPIMI